MLMPAMSNLRAVSELSERRDRAIYDHRLDPWSTLFHREADATVIIRTGDKLLSPYKPKYDKSAYPTCLQNCPEGPAIWEMMMHPSTDLEQIKARRDLITVLLKHPEKLDVAINLKEQAKKAIWGIDKLLDPLPRRAESSIGMIQEGTYAINELLQHLRTYDDPQGCQSRLAPFVMELTALHKRLAGIDFYAWYELNGTSGQSFERRTELALHELRTGAADTLRETMQESDLRALGREIERVITGVGIFLEYSRIVLRDSRNPATLSESAFTTYKRVHSICCPASRQHRSDSPEMDCGINIYTGGQGSGKSATGLVARLLLQLEAQTFGYGPGEEITLGIRDSIEFYDRGTGGAGLSALQNESQRLAEGEKVPGLRRMVFKDEPGSTTAEDDGARLVIAIAESAAAQGAEVHIATHNGALIRYAEERPDTYAIYSYRVEVHEAGITPLFELVRRKDEAHSLRVGAQMGYPAGILETAAKLRRGEVIATSRGESSDPRSLNRAQDSSPASLANLICANDEAARFLAIATSQPELKPGIGCKAVDGSGVAGQSCYYHRQFDFPFYPGADYRCGEMLLTANVSDSPQERRALCDALSDPAQFAALKRAEKLMLAWTSVTAHIGRYAQVFTRAERFLLPRPSGSHDGDFEERYQEIYRPYFEAIKALDDLGIAAGCLPSRSRQRIKLIESAVKKIDDWMSKLTLKDVRTLIDTIDNESAGHRKNCALEQLDYLDQCKGLILRFSGVDLDNAPIFAIKDRIAGSLEHGLSYFSVEPADLRRVLKLIPLPADLLTDEELVALTREIIPRGCGTNDSYPLYLEESIEVIVPNEIHRDIQRELGPINLLNCSREQAGPHLETLFEYHLARFRPNEYQTFEEPFYPALLAYTAFTGEGMIDQTFAMLDAHPSNMLKRAVAQVKKDWLSVIGPNQRQSSKQAASEGPGGLFGFYTQLMAAYNDELKGVLGEVQQLTERLSGAKDDAAERQRVRDETYALSERYGITQSRTPYEGLKTEDEKVYVGDPAELERRATIQLISKVIGRFAYNESHRRLDLANQLRDLAALSGLAMHVKKANFCIPEVSQAGEFNIQGLHHLHYPLDKWTAQDFNTDKPIIIFESANGSGKSAFNVALVLGYGLYNLFGYFPAKNAVIPDVQGVAFADRIVSTGPGLSAAQMEFKEKARLHRVRAARPGRWLRIGDENWSTVPSDPYGRALFCADMVHDLCAGDISISSTHDHAAVAQALELARDHLAVKHFKSVVDRSTGAMIFSRGISDGRADSLALPVAAAFLPRRIIYRAELVELPTLFESAHGTAASRPGNTNLQH